MAVTSKMLQSLFTEIDSVEKSLQEFSIYNPWALFRKSLITFDFLNSAPGVVYGKLR